MSQFRATKLDIGCFTKIRNIRDHTKRKVFAENEPERYALLRLYNVKIELLRSLTDKPSAISFATPHYHSV